MMNNIEKQDTLEQPGVGCMDASHLDPALRDNHTRGHCVPCCEALRYFGSGSTVVETMKQEHIRHMNTANR